MASNSLTTNLLTTSILSQLASFPQPVLRSVLLTPDIVFQPSVRGLYTALASLKQKLDNIMPTLPNSEEAVLAARRYDFIRFLAGDSNDYNSIPSLFKVLGRAAIGRQGPLVVGEIIDEEGEERLQHVSRVDTKSTW